MSKIGKASCSPWWPWKSLQLAAQQEPRSCLGSLLCVQPQSYPRARLNCWIKHFHSPIQIFVTAVPRTEVKHRCHNCVNWCVMGHSITAGKGLGGHSLPSLSQHRFDSIKCVLLLQTWHFKRFGQCNLLPLLLGIYPSSLRTHGQEMSHQTFP